MRLRAWPAALIVLAGCSTDPDAFTYRDVEATGATEALPPGSGAPDAAIVTVKREPGVNGFYVDHYFTIDGKRIARLDMGERTTIRVAPGAYNFGTDCPEPNWPAKNRMPVTVRPRQAYDVRIYSSFADWCLIETKASASKRPDLSPADGGKESVAPRQR